MTLEIDLDVFVALIKTRSRKELDHPWLADARLECPVLVHRNESDVLFRQSLVCKREDLLDVFCSKDI